jgi:hypothetical protein
VFQICCVPESRGNRILITICLVKVSTCVCASKVSGGVGSWPSSPASGVPRAHHL